LNRTAGAGFGEGCWGALAGGKKKGGSHFFIFRFNVFLILFLFFFWLDINAIVS